MELTKDYLLEQEDCIKRNFDGYKKNIHDPVTIERLETIKKFCEGAKVILCVGSGAHEPVYLNASHALDVHKVAEELLVQQGWKGFFFHSSCTAIPIHWKMFDVAVCSEVIEHLPTLKDAEDTFNELDRVAKRWIVTTPTRDVGEPTHKRVFNFDDLVSCTHNVQCKIVKRGLFWYVTKE